MKAIFSKYIPASNYKGSRVKAADEDGHSVTLSWDDALDSEGNHRAAAEALIRKMKWNPTRIVSGSLKAGYVWVMLDYRPGVAREVYKVNPAKKRGGKRRQFARRGKVIQGGIEHDRGQRMAKRGRRALRSLYGSRGLKINPGDLYTLESFKIGDRVELHPGTDAWMRGDRYGTVTSVGRLFVYIKLDKSGRNGKFKPRSIGQILESGRTSNPAPESSRKSFMGMRVRIQKFDADTWLESEEAAYPRGGKTRDGEARFDTPDGALFKVKAGIPDTYFSIPATAITGGRKVAGYLSIDQGVLVFHQRKKNPASHHATSSKEQKLAAALAQHGANADEAMMLARQAFLSHEQSGRKSSTFKYGKLRFIIKGK